MADDSGVEIGGDGSVQWVVRVANARKGSVRSTPEGETGYLQSGIDETPFDKPFTIGVKVPRTNGGALAEALRAAAEDAGKHAGEPGYVVTFPLVIEPDNVNQISVSWQSTPPAPSGKPSDPLGALIDKVKKVVRKVAGPKGAPAKSAAKKTAKTVVLTKAAAKKAPVKKAPAKKAPAKKASVKQAPAKKVKKAGKKK